MSNDDIITLDYSTIPYIRVDATANAALTTDFTNQLSANIATFPNNSVLLVIANANASGSVTETALQSAIYYNNDYLMRVGMVSVWGKFSSLHAVFVKTSGADTIELRMRKDNTSDVQAQQRSMTIIRVA